VRANTVKTNSAMNSNIQSNFVSVLEAIGYGLRRREYRYGDPIDAVLNDPGL